MDHEGLLEGGGAKKREGLIKLFAMDHGSLLGGGGLKRGLGLIRGNSVYMNS